MIANKSFGPAAGAVALAFALFAGGAVRAEELSNPAGNWGGTYKNSQPNSKEVYLSHINIKGSSGDWDGYKIVNLAPISRRDGAVVGWKWNHFQGGKTYRVTMMGRGALRDGTPHVYVEYDVFQGSVSDDDKDAKLLYYGGGYFDLNGSGAPPGGILGVPMDP